MSWFTDELDAIERRLEEPERDVVPGVVALGCFVLLAVLWVAAWALQVLP